MNDRDLEDRLAEELADAFPAKTEPLEPDLYADLSAILTLAYRQSSEGKGKDRHSGEGKPFDRQPIMEIARMTQGIDFHVGQVMKKAQEASTMVARGQHDRARAELLGVIVYAAAAFKRAGELKALASRGTSG